MWFSGLGSVPKVLDLMVGAGEKSIRKGKDTNLRVKKQSNKTLRLFTVPTFLNVTCNLSLQTVLQMTNFIRISQIENLKFSWDTASNTWENTFH